MAEALPEAALDQLFREARTCQWFDGRPVSEDQLHAIWDLARFGPTSMNMLPARIVWCHSDAAKERLAGHAMAGNKDKIRAAPVCAIIAMDTDFHLQMPMLFPINNVQPMFAGPEKAANRHTQAFRNSSLQGGYFIMAARALGLDTGPMTGFSNEAVDAAFFADQPNYKSVMLSTLGYGDPATIFDRSPRPDFDTFNRMA